MTARKLRSAGVVVSMLLALAPRLRAETVAITEGTLIDGTGRGPVENAVVLIDGTRITAVGSTQDVEIPASAVRIDASGKYVIPGLMDANVHLFFPFNLEMLVRYEGRYHEIVLEAAQIALKSGLTTVFDTWGHRESLIRARDMINAGEAPGSRIFLAGTIIGLEGPLTAEFIGEPPPGSASPAFVERVNQEWEAGVGRELTWMPPEELRPIVRDYVGGDVDFVKYPSSGHRLGEDSLIYFSPRVQKVIVEEGHRAGKTVQAHVTSVESMELAIEAGADIMTHGNISGSRVPLPDETIQELVDRKITVSILTVTERRLAALQDLGRGIAEDFEIAKINEKNMIQAGVTMMISTDATLYNPVLSPAFAKPEVDPRIMIGQGNVNVMVALEELGMEPMELLKAATSNTARAYRVDADLGTLEVGKIADIVILDSNPLENARNYGSVHSVIKSGVIVDRDSLPVAPIISTLTASE